MKAMILAAGLGTRLRPITDKLPKALVSVNGRPLLQHVIESLIRQNVTEIIINVHHQADKIIDFLKLQNNFNIRIEISYEKKILETGGGIKKAGWFFTDGKPFLVHNVDVLTNLDFQDMISTHNAQNALATLAVRMRDTRRQLLFNNKMELQGWKSDQKMRISTDADTGQMNAYSFMGIHVMSPEIFALFPQADFFSIIDAYLDIINEKKKIIGYQGDRFHWLDIGTQKKLTVAEKFMDEVTN